jgi:hypothetical protein
MGNIYYSFVVLPPGYRQETDQELKMRILEHIQKSPDNPKDNEAKLDNYLDNFLDNFGVAIHRRLVPLEEGDKVIYRTFTGDIEMTDLHKAIDGEKET